MNRFPSLQNSPSPRNKWSIWRKLAVFPMVPAMALLAMCVWIVIDETRSAPRIIDGSPDDAPRFAAAILAMVIPLVYVAYLIGLLAIWGMIEGFRSLGQQSE